LLGLDGVGHEPCGAGHEFYGANRNHVVPSTFLKECSWVL